MESTASLTGIFPRSEPLVAATRDLDRGRVTPEAVEALYRKEEAEVLALEERLGLAPVTGGFQRWPDLFRPIAETWRGFTVGTLTRFFETNTFFRQPILNHPPERVAGALAARLPTQALGSGHPAKVLLPGPYTLTGLLENRSGETPEALVHRFGRLFAAEAAELAGKGYREFQFQEPLLVVRPPSGPSAESVLAAYEAVRAAVPKLRLTVWTYLADARPAIPTLGRLPVDTVGVDLSETEPDELTGLPEHRGLGVGVLDPRTSLPEDPVEIARVVRTLVGRLKPSHLTLGPGGPLDLLPGETAARKLEVLPEALRQLAAPHGVPA
jgi:5-methyltetrahydropteroyltriglutamate--homocysteine methyltransferase